MQMCVVGADRIAANGDAANKIGTYSVAVLAKAHGIARWGTDVDAALANKDDTVFFDSGTTQMRPTLLAKAIRAGKHVYCEKPIATNLNEAVEIAQLAQKSGLKHGAVQDKLFLPGLRKLDMLRRAGFFGTAGQP